MEDPDIISIEMHAHRIRQRRLVHEKKVRAKRCAQCKMSIPNTLRIVSKFCSRKCRNIFHCYRRELLIKEITRVRRELIKTKCPECGEEVKQKVKPGPLRIYHEICAKRVEKRRERNK